MVLVINAQQHSTSIAGAPNKADTSESKYLTASVKPIRDNFRRINAIAKWSSVVSKDNNESTEGGEVKFYYLNGSLQKIIVKQFGETFQNQSEYYMLDGKLSFVLGKSYQYNRPIYYDSASMKDNNDTAVFDMKKSAITAIRSYFQDTILIHQVNDLRSGTRISKYHLLREQKRIDTEFKKLFAEQSND